LIWNGFRNIDESFAMPLFTIFRNLCMTPDSDPSRNPLLSIVAEMLNRCNKIGYLLIYFMKAGRRDSGEESTSAYSDLCRVMDESVDQRLVKDLRVCSIGNPPAVQGSLPMYSAWGNVGGNILHLIATLLKILFFHE
jgi:hypothetical protein